MNTITYVQVIPVLILCVKERLNLTYGVLLPTYGRFDASFLYCGVWSDKLPLAQPRAKINWMRWGEQQAAAKRRYTGDSKQQAANNIRGFARFDALFLYCETIPSHRPT